MKRLFLLFPCMVVLILACSKNSEDNLNQNPNNPPGGNTCDTVNMKYAADVVPILETNCYSCHGESTNSGSGGIVLQGYNNLKPRADNGVLLGTISHAAGFSPMPKNAGKLSACNINIIRSWIQNGAQNN